MSQDTILMIGIAIAASATFYCLTNGYIIPAIRQAQTKRFRITEMSDRDLEMLQKQKKDASKLLQRIKNAAEKYQQKTGSKAKNARAEKAEQELAHKLYAAGLPITPATYNFILSMTTLVALVIAVFAVILIEMPLDTMLIAVLGAAAGPFVIMRYYVSAKVTMREKGMETQLPDILDLLAISVGAGMGFDQAMTFITETMDGPLVDELAVLEQELKLGQSREQAFKSLGKNCNSKGVANFAAAVVQATQMGIPLHDMLVAQAEAARNEHTAAVRAKAAKASIRMLIPMVIFIFPVLFIILMGPAAMNIMQSGAI